MFLWVKAFHIVFVVAWFAGLLYLPRLFVYHADTEDEAGKERFRVMERRLFRLATVAAVGAGVFGGWLLVAWWWPPPASAGWLHAKLALVAGLVAYHAWCGKLVADFRADRNRHGARFYRIVNEIPALALIAVVVLAVVKPF